MKKVFFSVLLLTMLSASHAQVYTTYKSGPNTWGGAYVPPVWSKTYDFTIKPLKSIEVKGSAPKYSGPVYSGTPTYGKKTRWNLPLNNEGLGKKAEEMKEVLNEAFDNYFRELDESIQLFNAGEYKKSYDKLEHIDQNAQKTKRNFDDYKIVGIQDEYSKGTFQYMYIKYCYKYFCNVKLHDYEYALDLYNSFLSAHWLTGAGLDTRIVYPLTAEHYYIFDAEHGWEKPGFENINMYDRFRSDLFLVETLTGLGKMAEANIVMDRAMEFYPPLFKDLDYFLAPISIAYFYLNRPDESRKFLEYYCHKSQSNTARLAIIDEVLFNQKIRWNQADCPGCYKMVEDNVLFLDSLQQFGQNIPKFYSIKTWFELFVNRSDHADKFVVKADAEVADLFVYGTRGFYYGLSDAADSYLIALLRLGDESRLNAAIQKVAGVAAEIKEKEISALPENFKELEGMKYLYKDPGSVRYYWFYYNRVKARPYSRALEVFCLPGFIQAGGMKYLQKYAEPLLKEVSKYTWEETALSIDFSTRSGLPVKFLDQKKRKYPRKLD